MVQGLRSVSKPAISLKKTCGGYHLRTTLFALVHGSQGFRRHGTLYVILNQPDRALRSGRRGTRSKPYIIGLGRSMSCPPTSGQVCTKIVKSMKYNGVPDQKAAAEGGAQVWGVLFFLSERKYTQQNENLLLAFVFFLFFKWRVKNQLSWCLVGSRNLKVRLEFWFLSLKAGVDKISVVKSPFLCLFRKWPSSSALPPMEKYGMTSPTRALKLW